MGNMLSLPLTSYRRTSSDIGPCRVEAGAEHEAVLYSASCANLEMDSYRAVVGNDFVSDFASEFGTATESATATAEATGAIADTVELTACTAN